MVVFKDSISVSGHFASKKRGLHDCPRQAPRSRADEGCSVFIRAAAAERLATWLVLSRFRSPTRRDWRIRLATLPKRNFTLFRSPHRMYGDEDTKERNIAGSAPPAPAARGPGPLFTGRRLNSAAAYSIPHTPVSCWIRTGLPITRQAASRLVPNIIPSTRLSSVDVGSSDPGGSREWNPLLKNFQARRLLYNSFGCQWCSYERALCSTWNRGRGPTRDGPTKIARHT